MYIPGSSSHIENPEPKLALYRERSESELSNMTMLLQPHMFHSSDMGCGGETISRIGFEPHLTPSFGRARNHSSVTSVGVGIGSNLGHSSTIASNIGRGHALSHPSHSNMAHTSLVERPVEEAIGGAEGGTEAKQEETAEAGGHQLEHSLKSCKTSNGDGAFRATASSRFDITARFYWVPTNPINKFVLVSAYSVMN